MWLTPIFGYPFTPNLSKSRFRFYTHAHDRPKKVSIIIPAYNEEGNIPNVILRLEKQAAALRQTCDFEFLVLDNNNSDRTR